MSWEKLRQLGRSGSIDELNKLFAGGSDPNGLDGPTDGMLVVPSMGSVRTPLVKAISRFYMPWLGKRFFAGEKRGDNRFVPSVRFPAKLLWPHYATRSNGAERTAFDFVTCTEAG